MPVRRYEIIGGPDRGVGHFSIPGEFSLPDDIKKYDFRAKKVYWMKMADIDKDNLAKALEGLDGDTAKLKELFLKEDADWSMFVVRGKDCSSRAVRKDIILAGLAPPGAGFAEGPFHIASVKAGKNGHYELRGVFSQKPALTTEGPSKEEYLKMKQEQFPNANRKEKRKWRTEWLDNYGPPYLHLYPWLKGDPSQTDALSIAAMKLALASASLQLRDAAEARVKAASLEPQVGALVDLTSKMDDQIHDQQVLIAAKTHETELLETIARDRTRPAPQLEEAVPMNRVATKQSQATKTEQKKESALNPQWLFVGLALIGAIALFTQYWIGGAVVSLLAVAGFYYDSRVGKYKAAKAEQARKALDIGKEKSQDIRDEVKEKIG